MNVSGIFWSTQLTIGNTAPTWDESFASVSLNHDENLSIQLNVSDDDSADTIRLCH